MGGGRPWWAGLLLWACGEVHRMGEGAHGAPDHLPSGQGTERPMVPCRGNPQRPRPPTRPSSQAPPPPSGTSLGQAHNTWSLGTVQARLQRQI